MGLILKMLLVNYKFRETQSYFQRYLGNLKSIPHTRSEIKLISGLTLKKALDKSKGREWERYRERDREREKEKDTDTEIQNKWLDFRFRALYIEISENPLFYLDFGK